MIESYAQNNLFRILSLEDRAALDLAIEERRYPASQLIFDDGDTGKLLYLVREGRVKISKETAFGTEQILGFIEENDFFGEFALIDNQPRSARTTAETDCTLGIIDQEGLTKLLSSSPEMSMYFTRLTIGRLREANQTFMAEIVKAEQMGMLGRMAARIIHDLRNPIGALSMASEMVDDHADPESMKILTKVVHKTTAQLTALIQDLQDYSRGSAQIELNFITPSQILENLDELVLKDIDKTNVTVHRLLSWNGEFPADIGRISRVMMNMVKNAHQAMPMGGELFVKFDKTENMVLIEIRDTGCGFPMGVADQIFEPFFTHEKAGRIGLGLANARNILEAHHGRVEVESVENKGSLFRLLIPASA